MKRLLAGAALALILSSPTFAADSTVSAMTAASTLGGTELTYCVQGGADRKCTMNQIAAWANTFPLVAAGTTNSGGIPYFSSATALSSSAALAANALMIGGGAGAAPSTTTTGTGVVTAIGSNVNTNGGLLTASTAAIAANAIVTGAGSGTALTGITPGTGVLTALGIAPGTTGSFTLQNGAITNGNCLEWSATGIVDAGAACGSGGGSPGGSGTELQYRSGASTFGGMAGTSWDDTNRSLTMTGATITGASSKPILDLSQTWNNATTAFTGFKLNVTNTASDSTSKVVDVQIGGTTKFSIRQDGYIDLPNNTHVAYGNLGGTYGGNGVYFDSNIWVFSSNISIQWTDGTTSGSVDTYLGRAAAATLRMGNADAASPVAQALQVQNVVAGTSNTAGANFVIRASKGTGNGVAGDIIFSSAVANGAATAQNVGLEMLRIKGSASGDFNPGRILVSGQIESSGAKPTAAGSGGTCATGTIAGGANAGTVTLTAACAATDTVTLTFKTAAATGWSCFAMNRNTPANLMQETSTSTTTAVLTAAGTTSGATDVIQYACTAY